MHVQNERFTCKAGDKEYSSHERVSLSSHIGATLRKYRLKKHIGNAEMAQLVHVTAATIGYWENGKSRPDTDMLMRLRAMLDIPLNELFDVRDDDSLSAEEREIIQYYRHMSKDGQSLVHAAVCAMAEDENARHRDMLRNSYRLLEMPDTPAAAGAGSMFGDCAPGYCFTRINDQNRACDAIIRVSGHSMEPVYNDGDLVYLKYTQERFINDDIVCSTSDGAVIKRVGAKGLYSVNPDYPYAQKYEDDHVRQIGRVMGIVSQDDIASGKDRDVLGEVFCSEIRQFIKKTRSTL